jgi:ParB family chromosome partitioning protein
MEPVEREPSPAGSSEAPIESIRPNPYQPRDAFDQESLAELAASIREQGLLQPLIVRRAGEGFELIAGERRFRAAMMAGLERVPVTVRDANDRESLELALIENLQREDLNPIEEARAYQRLMEEFSLGQEEIARRVGKNRSTVSNAIRLLQLPPDVRARVESGALSAGHARSLLGLVSGEEQAEAADRVIRERLSVREVERLVRKRTRPISPAPVDPDRRALETDLSRELGTRVRLVPGKNGAGRIEIEYYSAAELDGLLARLSNQRGCATNSWVGVSSRGMP